MGSGLICYDGDRNNILVQDTDGEFSTAEIFIVSMLFPFTTRHFFYIMNIFQGIQFTTFVIEERAAQNALTLYVADNIWP